MNYDILHKLVPTRSLPDDASAPRNKLFELFRILEELRDAAAQPGAENLDKQIKFYEQILET